MKIRLEANLAWGSHRLHADAPTYEYAEFITKRLRDNMSTRYPWAEFGLRFELTRLVNFAYLVTNLSTSIQTNTRTPAKILKTIFRCSCLEVPRGSYSAMMTLSHTDSQAVLRLIQTDKSPKK